MRIGLIGAGLIGRAVAQRVIAAGHEAMLSNSRGPETMGDVLRDIPEAELGTVKQAAQFGEVVLIALPFRHYPSVPAHWLENKIVMDANNYYPQRDGRIQALDQFETTTSRMIARHLASSRVVKAFNAILAGDLRRDARPPGTPYRRALPVAADDHGAKSVIIRLLDQIGFDAVDAGSLDDSWRFERAKPAYCLPLDREGLTRALASAEREVELPDGSWRPS